MDICVRVRVCARALVCVRACVRVCVWVGGCAVCCVLWVLCRQQVQVGIDDLAHAASAFSEAHRQGVTVLLDSEFSRNRAFVVIYLSRRHSLTIAEENGCFGILFVVLCRSSACG